MSPTGHQPTFPSIHWHAAFVGFSGADYGSSSSSASALATFVLPATLIGWNTFASRVLFGLGLPALLLAPFCLWLAWPAVRRHYHVQAKGGVPTVEEGVVTQEDFDQGEVFLLERPEEARSQLFKLCCKYLCLQTFRLLSTMFAAAVLRRHLMVWKIFAPRFVFEAVGFLVSLACVVASFAASARVLSVMVHFYRRLEKEEE